MLSSSSEMWKSKLGKNYPKDFMKAKEKKFNQQLQALRREPANCDCADCGAKGCTMWASVNLGVFLCLTCGSHHRSLGTHISKPKGCTGTYWWGPDELENMRVVGNERASQIYGNMIPPGLTPADTMGWRKYITDKYVHQKYAPSSCATTSEKSQEPLEFKAQGIDPLPSLVKEEVDLLTFDGGKGRQDFFATFGATTSASSNPLVKSPQSHDADLLGLNNEVVEDKGLKIQADISSDIFFADFGL